VHDHVGLLSQVSCGVLLGAGDVIQQHLVLANSLRECESKSKKSPARDLVDLCNQKSKISSEMQFEQLPSCESLNIGSHLVEHWQRWDFDEDRTWRMFLVGLSQGPPHHVWYTWLDKVNSFVEMHSKWGFPV
jgi:hypothetical protein